MLVPKFGLRDLDHTGQSIVSLTKKKNCNWLKSLFDKTSYYLPTIVQNLIMNESGT